MCSARTHRVVLEAIVVIVVELATDLTPELAVQADPMVLAGGEHTTNTVKATLTSLDAITV